MASTSSIGRVLNTQHPIPVDCCRSCSFKYQFRLDDGEIITILCGRPSQDITYKAVSYLWETEWPPQRVALACRSCSSVKNIPMRDVEKLWSLLKCLKGGIPVWLDTLSIDQDDESDKELQLPVMGDIYKRAKTVTVLLPAADKKAYDQLKKLCTISAAIVTRHKDFGMLADAGNSGVSYDDEELTKLADEYIQHLTEWTGDVEKWKYWRRAWTFQEWTMASEIDLCLETPLNVKIEGMMNIKNVVVMAVTIVVHWKTLRAKSSHSLGADRLREEYLVREEYSKYLLLVKGHFPFQDFVFANPEEDPDDTRRQTVYPTSSTSSATEIVFHSRINENQRFYSLLGLALNAMSRSKREATYERDLVACWASMCNVDYNGKDSDTYNVALHKVVTALRKRGIRIYNWLANTDAAETDLNFLDYAAAQPQSNAVSRSYYTGSPIFIGRADTVAHIKSSLDQDDNLIHIGGSFDVTVRVVEKAIIKRPVLWSDKEAVIHTFRSIISGTPDGKRILDVGNIVQTELDHIPQSKLQKHFLVTVSIGVEDVYTMWYFNAWAICPSNIPLHDLFVARESLNGTLVLALFMGTKPAKEARIVAYLNTTHQRDGTYLLKADDKGIVDIVFRTADTPQHELFWMPEGALDQMAGPSLVAEHNIMNDLKDRVVDVKIFLGNRTLPMIKPTDETKL